MAERYEVRWEGTLDRSSDLDEFVHGNVRREWFDVTALRYRGWAPYRELDEARAFCDGLRERTAVTGGDDYFRDDLFGVVDEKTINVVHVTETVVYPPAEA